MIQHIFLAMFLVGSSSAGIVPDSKPCTEFQTAQSMQGLTINDSTLYAIVNFHVYSFPLSPENVLSGGRIALFNMTDEGLWSDLPWLEDLVKKTMQHTSGWETLLQLNLITTKKKGSFEKLVHAIYKKSPEEQNSFTFELLSELPLHEVDGKMLNERFAVFSDGAGHGYIVRNMSKGQVPVFLPNPVAKSTDFSVTFPALANLNHPSYFATISKPGHLTLNPTSSSNSIQEHNLFVSEPENAFGFLFNGTFHYWDLSKRQVFLFKDPLSVEDRTVRFKTVPMSKYFVCSQELWSNSIPSDDYDIEYITTSETSSLFAWLIIAGLIIAVFILLLAFVLWRVYSKEKRTLTINKQENRSPKSRLFLRSLNRVPSSANSMLPSMSATSFTPSSPTISYDEVQPQQQVSKSGKVNSTQGQLTVSSTPSTITTSAFSFDYLKNRKMPIIYKVGQKGNVDVYRMDPTTTSALPSAAPSWTTSEVLNAPSSVDSELETTKTTHQKKTPKSKK